jgi:putative oxidoreductase
VLFIGAFVRFFVSFFPTGNHQSFSSMSFSIGDIFKKPETGLLLLRVSAGAAMILHGVPKFIGGAPVLESVGSAISVYGLHGHALAWGFAAATVEVLGGLLLILGVCSRFAALALFCVLLTALISIKPSLTLSAFGGWAHPAMMMMTFLALFFTGPGEYSLSGGGKGGKSSKGGASPEPKKAPAK